jgi:GH43 family beta-xylosidase
MTEFFRLQVLFPILVILVVGGEHQNWREPAPVENTFENPLLSKGADPWVLRKDGWYYVTHTTGKDLRLYRTRKMSDLRNAEITTVWTPPATGMNSKQIWAPEIHFLNGKWYFYYSADDGLNENHRMWVLENAAADPFTGTWVDKGQMKLPAGKWAIDGTVFEKDSQLYFLWSGWEGNVNVRQNIYATKLMNPWTAEGDRVLLSTPELAWEKIGGTPAINEAPQFLRKGDKMFIVYSASGCWTDDYKLGMLSAHESADPLDPASWTKLREPVFEKNTSGQSFGPGHNSFFISPDGTEDWILYHANPETGQGCGGNRSPRMQKFTWTRSGFPEFGTPAALGVAIDVPSGE